MDSSSAYHCLQHYIDPDFTQHSRLPPCLRERRTSCGRGGVWTHLSNNCLLSSYLLYDREAQPMEEGGRPRGGPEVLWTLATSCLDSVLLDE